MSSPSSMASLLTQMANGSKNTDFSMLAPAGDVEVSCFGGMTPDSHCRTRRFREARVQIGVRFEDNNDEYNVIQERIARALGEHLYGDLSHSIFKAIHETKREIADKRSVDIHFPTMGFVTGEILNAVGKVVEPYCRKFDYKVYHISEVTPAMACNWLRVNCGLDFSIRDNSASEIMGALQNYIENWRSYESEIYETSYFEKDVHSRGRPKLFDVVI